LQVIGTAVAVADKQMSTKWAHLLNILVIIF
jgi:hypothetical protein